MKIFRWFVDALAKLDIDDDVSTICIYSPLISAACLAALHYEGVIQLPWSQIFLLLAISPFVFTMMSDLIVMAFKLIYKTVSKSALAINGFEKIIRSLLGPNWQVKDDSSDYLERVNLDLIDPYIAVELPDLSNEEQVDKILEKFLRDQLGRPKLPTERIETRLVQKISAQKSQFLLTYRKVETFQKNGVERQRVLVSAHVVTLTLNHLALTVDYTSDLSFSQAQLTGVGDVFDFVRRVADRLGSDTSPDLQPVTESSDPVVAARRISGHSRVSQSE